MFGELNETGFSSELNKNKPENLDIDDFSVKLRLDDIHRLDSRQLSSELGNSDSPKIYVDGVDNGIKELDQSSSLNGWKPDMKIYEIHNLSPNQIECSNSKDFSANSDIPQNKINEIKNCNGFSYENLSDYTENTTKKDTEKISYELHTRNESLEGDRHPITGVPFERRTVEDSDGNKVTGVFPIFESKDDIYLPKNLEQGTDKEQFENCNAQLKEEIEKNPDLAKQFTKEQLEQINNGDTPDGYTWHHNEEKGKMQLVDADTHAKTGHTGGKSIWGGGSDNR